MKREHPNLERNKQIFILPKCAIEQCYPDHDSWQRTQEKTKTMSGGDKVKLAKNVGEKIAQWESETYLKIVFNALQKCWELAF
ncbi:MAG: hypothetical protein LBJ03_03420 [Holosporales bacterium]|nr:hypothetical protein [Holosporales bacterium]